MIDRSSVRFANVLGPRCYRALTLSKCYRSITLRCTLKLPSRAEIRGVILRKCAGNTERVIFKARKFALLGSLRGENSTSPSSFAVRGGKFFKNRLAHLSLWSELGAAFEAPHEENKPPILLIR